MSLDALQAALNCTLPDGRIEVMTLPGQCDLLLMADVLYDRQNLPLLDTVQIIVPRVWLPETRICTRDCRATLAGGMFFPWKPGIQPWNTQSPAAAGSASCRHP